MRTVTHGRSRENRRASDIQAIIDDDAVTVSIYRMVGDNITAPAVETLMATFEARLDFMKARYRDLERHDIVGQATNMPYLMLTRKDTDAQGRAITYQRGDTALINGVRYLVIYRDDSYSYKTDGLLEVIT